MKEPTGKNLILNVEKTKRGVMCLQCLTDAVILKEEILPGYHLMKAMKDAEGWKKDQFGLIRQNDPDFVWDNPGPEPCAGMPDEEINNCPEEKWDRQTEWQKKVEQIEKNFISDPMTCYEFVATCMAVGYDPKKDGFNVVMWFIHYCAEKIEK